jgi:hypothetical protein
MLVPWRMSGSKKHRPDPSNKSGIEKLRDPEFQSEHLQDIIRKAATGKAS